MTTTDKLQTRLDREERAYNTPNGGHSRSNRRGKAIYPDGKIRSVTAGIPDTYFSIPAHGRIGRKYVSGFLGINDEGEYYFHIYERTPNA